MNAEGWIDITMTLQNGIVNWLGDPAFEIHKISSVEKAEMFTSSPFSKDEIL